MKNKIEHNGLDSTFLTIYSVVLALYFTIDGITFSNIKMSNVIEFIAFIILLICASIVMPAIRVLIEERDLNKVGIEILIFILSCIGALILENRFAFKADLKNFLHFYLGLIMFWVIATAILSVINQLKITKSKESKNEPVTSSVEQ